MVQFRLKFHHNRDRSNTPELHSSIPGQPHRTQGNFWINHSWEPGAGNDTDSYNVSVNGSWTNGTTSTYDNTTVAAHGWSNISVYSYNSSGTGTLNTTSVSNNTQVSNNLVTIGNISSSYTVTAGDTISIYPTSSDLDGDIPTFGRNFSNGTFYPDNWNPLLATESIDTGLHSLQHQRNRWLRFRVLN